MKRKLFVALVLLVTGSMSERLWDAGKAWWNAPPEPPSAEAQRLIASLEAVDGWRLTHKENSRQPRLKKGNVLLVPSNTIWFWQSDRAFVEVDGANCDEQFTVQDRIWINRAAETCLRKLAAKALTETTAAAQ